MSSILSISNMSLSFGDKPILSNANLIVEKGEKLALIGRNGSGKSTLFSLIKKNIEPDSGEVFISQGLKIVLVEQELIFNQNINVRTSIAQGHQNLFEKIKYYKELNSILEKGNKNKAQTQDIIPQIEILQHEISNLNGWALNSNIDKLLDIFQLDGEALISSLSGGQLKRLSIARAMIQEPDLLLLDEPTNHLDIGTISWLENYLTKTKQTVIVISHDRYFLDNIANRIIEIDRGNIHCFTGGFDNYKKRKVSMIESEMNANREFDKLLSQEEAWIRKGIEARRTRNEGRVRRLEQLRIERKNRMDLIGKVNFSLDLAKRSGNKVVELKNVSKSFNNDNALMRKLSLIITRGDKVALIGANGSGKSTLIRIILGEIEPDNGIVSLGTNLKIAYFDQMRETIDDNVALYEAISPGSDSFVEINGKKKHVITYLEDFLFSPQKARAKVRTLSGGERNRLLLARLFALNANFIVLDEPTNDLDIETLELLEAIIQDYKGTILIVSHDRAFIDNIATQTVVAKGNGQWVEYIGGYNAINSNISSPLQEKEDKMSKKNMSNNKQSRSNKKNKLSYKEEKDLKEIPDKIAELELEQSKLAKHLENQSINNDFDKISKVADRLSEIDKEVNILMERWMELEHKKTKLSI